MAQMGFFDLSDRYASLDAKKDPLLEIDEIVPWEEFRPLLKKVWRKPLKDRKSRAGRKPWDEIIMFKALVLSVLYNLSDDQPKRLGEAQNTTPKSGKAQAIGLKYPPR